MTPDYILYFRLEIFPLAQPREVPAFFLQQSPFLISIRATHCIITVPINHKPVTSGYHFFSSDLSFDVFCRHAHMRRVSSDLKCGVLLRLMHKHHIYQAGCQHFRSSFLCSDGATSIRAIKR
ncbi:hypothetical protein Zmor_018096 [Zophobas morio]|uniref:Uncharacterized protein n=1 Tax=Zophobas morio TaxID=2755281 RepID=A0AA38MCS0_9CUCU|nr:hypothetical protein Zmor_018096 [Zophobas morio]